VNLLQRCLVAAVGIPALYLLIRLGSWYFLLLVATQAGLAAREFYSMARKKGLRPLAGLGTILAAALPFFTFQALTVQSSIWFSSSVSLALIAVAAAALIGSQGVEGAIDRISVTAFGFLYFGGLFSTQLLLRLDPAYPDLAGVNWLFLAYLLTWAVDTGSYTGGKLFGRRKLSPVLSPGKTCEGAVGGLLLAVAASYFLGTVWMGLFGWSQALVYGLLIGIAAPAGDLVISVFKRDSGVKDSSRLIPGHGGVLDRFDSLLFTVPVSVIFRYFITPV
jgi:phosphatidate cytidylyltransferase